MNEIVVRTMKSMQCMDEICFADEIKSVYYPDKVGFHREAISHIKDGFIPSVRTDLVKKALAFASAFLQH